MPYSNRIISWLYPRVSNVSEAVIASRQGFWASLLVAVLTLILSISALLGYQNMGIGPEAISDAFVFSIIGYGIKKYSRFASLIGLLIFILERIYMYKTVGSGTGVMSIVLSFMFINSIRGTFAYHKYIGTKLNWISIVIKIVVAIVTSLVSCFAVLLATIFLPAIAELSNNLKTFLVFAPAYVLFVLSFNGLLPFTKRRNIVQDRAV